MIVLVWSHVQEGLVQLGRFQKQRGQIAYAVSKVRPEPVTQV